MKNNWISKRLIVLLYLFVSAPVFSQDDDKKSECQTIENKKAVKLYEKGCDKKKYNKDERMNFLREAMKLEEDYVDANYQYSTELLIRMRLDNIPFKAAEPFLLKVIQICPDYHSDPYYYLGFSAWEQEKWDESVKYMEKFIAFKADDDKKYSKNYEAQLEQAKQMIIHAKENKEFEDRKKKPVPFDPRPVSDICTQYDEYLPIISPDDKLMFFTRKMPDNSKDRSYQTDKWMERFCSAKRKEEQFEKGGWMPSPFNRNQNDNQGGATISIDNKHLFFTLCRNEGGPQVNCDIYYSDLYNGEWTEIKKVEGINDPAYWDSQPTMASDGKTLYFSSNRKGGMGGIDLYKTVKDELSGKWSQPINLGRTINTEGNEKSPFMHSDSETLYFSSDGHMGFGSMDIFMAKKNDKGEWGTPRNIGFPINTAGDDLGFFVSTDGHYGYFASNDLSRMKGKAVGGWDIYYFDLYEEARPDKVALVKGTVVDQKGAGVKNAIVEIKNAKTKEKTDVVMDTATGQYAAIVNLRKNENVIITMRKDSMAFNSQLISLSDSGSVKKPVRVKMEAKKVKLNEVYIINNIYFGSNSSSIKEESKTVLEEFAEYLKLNPNLKIQIQGYTDNVGEDASNMKLSDDRANSVKTFLEEKGVEKNRMTARGFGETKPVATNDNELGRAKNRRTEFMVMGM